jgi:hypothetical protein
MSDEIQRPTKNDDRDAWKACWETLGMPWRTEPEGDREAATSLGGAYGCVGT